MQLDKTHFVIRERGFLETLDLALHVIRRYWRALAVTYLLGAVPLMLLNHLMIQWMLDASFGQGVPYRFTWHMIVLVVIEAPLASIFMTSYLGQAVFDQHPKLGQVISEVFRFSWPLLWHHLIWRGGFLVGLLVLSLDRQRAFQSEIEIFGLGLLLGYALVVRGVRPFINEIILLEKNPLTTRNSQVMTVGMRSKLLHSPSSSELLGRSMAAGLFAPLLALSVAGGFLCISGTMLHDWTPGPWMIQLGLPVALWLVAGYFSVVRFLSYLDTRIRHEGWEVELKVRAEAAQLRSRLS